MEPQKGVSVNTATMRTLDKTI